MIRILDIMKQRLNPTKRTMVGFFIAITIYCFTLAQQKAGSPCPPILYGFHTNDEQPTKTTIFNSTSFSELMGYIKWTNQPACERVGYYGGVITKFMGQALMDGQKAICLDNGTQPKMDDCLVYSIGINNDWSFDEAMERYGCHIYSFDPSMNQKEHNHTSKIHFYPIGLSAKDETLRVGGKGKQLHLMNTNNITTFDVMTLSSIYRMLSPMHGENTIIDYLKIDIESEEWNVIPQLIESGILDKVRQMGVEIHLTHRENENLKDFRKEANILYRLETEGGMTRFDSKLNAFSNVTFKEMGNLTGYYAHEIAWFNRKYHHYH